MFPKGPRIERDYDDGIDVMRCDCIFVFIHVYKREWGKWNKRKPLVIIILNQ